MMAAALPKGWNCGAEAAKLFAILEERLRPEIASRARKAEAMGVAEFDDAVQEGRIALLNVVARFDPERGDLEHYARRALRNAFASSVREARKRRARLEPLQPIHEPAELTTPERTLLDRDFIRRISVRAEKCSERERSILLLGLAGMKRAEICRELGLTKIQGEWAAGKLRRHFESLKAEVACHG